ncbi:hypothetical protein D9615_004781 [Tricholomella constricta]|uniref:Major facilitator superfamily (MFS) profile domain-containing protein n=1 Tax=Tricholomella constricta TaxID=117010 RepID=A0A8H5HHV9_9AGAR|nr:hypothetical protein D9615_004781 [Tricholomella constricta]
MTRHFGLLDASGKKTHRVNEVSSNVVSVLQAGAFFGALGSAPLSGADPSASARVPTLGISDVQVICAPGRLRLVLVEVMRDEGALTLSTPRISPKIGRIYTLWAFTVIFVAGAILTTVAEGSNGLACIYAGRVISGLGIGAISAVSPAYVSEWSIDGYGWNKRWKKLILHYLDGVGLHIRTGVNVWRVPFGFQLVPAGIMAIGLLTIKESPRWLASVGRNEQAIKNLAYLRKEPIDSESILSEMVEIEAAIEEERQARRGLGIKEAFFGKGNFIRFVIAFVIFLLQQWAGQNSDKAGLTSIGYSSQESSLLASGIYGVVKVVATAIFISFGVETLGRKLSLFISAMGMGTLFYIIGAILKTHPPPPVIDGVAPDPPPASRAMAGLLYIYVCFYSMGWGPLPWVYVSDIFPTRTRHYGLALASSSQWLWNFVVSKVTPDMISDLGYKIFIMFATVNIGAMGLFSLLVPETKGRSLEEMDVIFGSISAEQRQAHIDERTRADAHAHAKEKGSSDLSNSVDNKV